MCVVVRVYVCRGEGVCVCSGEGVCVCSGEGICGAGVCVYGTDAWPRICEE